MKFSLMLVALILCGCLSKGDRSTDTAKVADTTVHAVPAVSDTVVRPDTTVIRVPSKPGKHKGRK